MEQQQQYVNIYTEANPNPNSLKFVTNFLIAPENKDYDFETADAATASPLAQGLFQMPFVSRVFIMNNFVTITKNDSVEWPMVKDQLKEYIKQHLQSGQPIIDEEAVEAGTKENFDDADAEIVTKIKDLLNEYVRPAVESDGGAINFAAYQNGVVTVELRGSCSGCPSSTLTLKQGIENLLRRVIPEIKSVEALSM